MDPKGGFNSACAIGWISLIHKNSKSKVEKLKYCPFRACSLDLLKFNLFEIISLMITFLWHKKSAPWALSLKIILPEVVDNKFKHYALSEYKNSGSTTFYY